MGPTWLVPIIVSVLVAMWKISIIRQSSSRRGHLIDLCSYVGVAFLFYILLYWLGVEIANLVTGVTYGPIIHVGTIIAFLVCYVFVLSVVESRSTKLEPGEIGTLVDTMNEMLKSMNKTKEFVEELDGGYRRLSERVGKIESDVANRMGEAAGRIDGAVENMSRRMNDVEETDVMALNKYREISGEIHEWLEERREEMEKVAENQRKNIEALREEVKTFRGAMAEVKGREWEDVIADRIKKLGFGVEVGRLKRQPDVVIKDSEGNVVGVVGCKSYKLKSRRGMSDKFKPEVRLAREEGVPLAVAIQNRLNDLEFFKIYERGELEKFSCSAPTWLAGEDASEQDRVEQAKCRREFKEFIAKIS